MLQYFAFLGDFHPVAVHFPIALLPTAALLRLYGWRRPQAWVEPTLTALLLPPLAGMRRHHAILAPAGTYTSRRFVLVREGRHLYVAQGRVLSMEVQTASVELFQYEIDPYAL